MNMRVVDLSLQTPEMNLALDEALLDAAEEGHGGATLRFWESPTPFVVLGVGQVLAEEVDAAACAVDGVPVLRRCTAGGCVLQGPGSLNYSLVFVLEETPEVRTLKGSYCHILHALSDAFAARGLAVVHEGVSDLVYGGRKVSGNAQRRRRRAILHHGSLLYAADFAAMARYLREPMDRPEYRGARTHAEFVGVLPLGVDGLKEVVREAFGAASEGCSPPGDWPLAHAEALAREKYLDREWTYRR